MKRLLVLTLFLALVAILAPGQAAQADVTISATFTDGQAARIDRARVRINRATCAYFGLPANCNTTQARTVFCQRANLTGSACEGATQFIIYGTVELFAKRELLRLTSEQYAAEEVADDAAAAKAAFDGKTQAQKDAICASLGLAAGCTPF